MNKNDAIKYAVHQAPQFVNDILDIANKLTAIEPTWERLVGQGYTLDQLKMLLEDLRAGKTHETLPYAGDAPHHRPHPAQQDIVEGIFTIKEQDFSRMPVDMLEYRGEFAPKSKFYLTKICKNCGAGMCINFDSIPKDPAEIRNAMMTLERVFLRAGHEDLAI